MIIDLNSVLQFIKKKYILLLLAFFILLIFFVSLYNLYPLLLVKNRAIEGVVSSEAVDSCLLTNSSVGNFNLGMERDSVEKILSKFTKYDGKNTQDGMHLVQEMQNGIYVDSFKIGFNTTDDGGSYLDRIDVLSDKYQTKEGIHVGITIKSLLEKYPQAEFHFDNLGNEYFYVKELNSAEKNKQVNSIMVLNVRPTNSKLLSVRSSAFLTDQYSTEGYVYSIKLLITDSTKDGIEKFLFGRRNSEKVGIQDNLEIINDSTDIPNIPFNASVIAKNGIRLRDNPGINTNKIDHIPFNTLIKVVELGESEEIDGTIGKWCRVEWQNKSGWVFGGFLTTGNVPQNNVAAESENFLITRNSVGNIKMGMDYSDVMKLFPAKQYSFYDDSGLLYIKENGKNILAIGNRNDNQPPFIVKTIIVYSEAYKTSSGAHVGMRIQEFIDIYTTSLKHGYEGTEFFDITYLLAEPDTEDPYYGTVLCSVRPDNKKQYQLGRYVDASAEEESTEDFSKEGQIINFELWQKN